MSTQNTVITLEQLGHDFTSMFRHRAFRLETLDYYDAPNELEPYSRFRAGEAVDPAWREPWANLIREVRATGRVMQRVKIVHEPAGEYVRFSLLHAAPASVAAGEDVRVLGWQAAAEAEFVPGDWWLFDDNLAALLDYDTYGRIKQVELVETSVLCGTRDEALRLSTPLAQYVAEHNITDERHAA